MPPGFRPEADPQFQPGGGRKSLQNDPPQRIVTPTPVQQRVSFDEQELLKEAPPLDASQHGEGSVQVSDADQPTFRTLSRKQTVQVTQVPFEQKLELYRENANKTNDPRVLFEYARFCIENSDTHKAEGFQMLRKIASGGYLEAMHYLGQAFEDDNNYDLAYAQYSTAAKRAHPPSCYKVGCFAENGYGVKTNLRLSLQMYTKAATAGDKDAMLRLGMAELKGELTLKKDVSKAIKWFKRGVAVADKEHAEPVYQLARIYEDGSPPDVYPDKNYARSLLLEACQLDYVPAIFRLAQCFEYGYLGCPLDVAESHRLYQVAASKGDAESKLALAGWYMTGVEGYIPKDEAKAFQLTKQASEQDLPHAMYALGFLYEKGVGVEPSREDALKLYTKAAEKGEDRALKRLKELDPSASPQLQQKKKKGLMSFFSK
ncbi:hypothetical protein EDD86DRAFT_188911 [Gorgonomyces haynaldii]|nr:hypothetical protein EDD86DRAFT_188911 [Gorgonomyces haynaldii]